MNAVNTQDLICEAHSAASSRISDLLAHPDDLFTKLPSLKSKIIAEKASVEAQLKTLLESQLDDAQKGLDTMASCRIEASEIQRNLESIQVQLNDSDQSIDNYAKIMQISKTHQNFVVTKEMVMQFRALNDQIARIKYFLDQDSVDMLGDHSSLLIIHHQIYQLEAFKQATVNQTQDTTSDVAGTLEAFFRKIDKLNYDFESYFWSLAKLTIPLMKAGQASVIVNIVKVIETEEKADLAVLKTQVSLANQDKKRPAIKTGSRQAKSFRIKYFDALREVFAGQFHQLKEEYKNDLEGLLEQVSLIIDDLGLVHDELVPRFPQKYNIFQFFVLEHHRITHELLEKSVTDDVGNDSILALLRWVQDYYDKMSGRLGVGEELLEPKLLDGKDEYLGQKYVKNVKILLNDWLSKLLSTEIDDFTLRREAPELDHEGCYIMSGSVILFQMFNQQIDACCACSRSSLLKNVVSECIKCMGEYQGRISDALDVEFKKFESKQAQLAQGLPEYVMAVANDTYRSTEFTEEMINKLEEVMEDPFRQDVVLRLKQISFEFMKISKKAYAVLIDIVMIDCKPALTHMFTSVWYEQELMKLVLGTLEDYCNDFEAHLTSHLFTKQMNDLMDRTVLAYLECLRHKQVKFKMPFAAEKIKTELQMMIEFFCRFKAKKRVKQSLDVLEKILSFLESNARMAYMDFYNLWKAYPDVTYGFMEDLVYKRDDLEKSQVKEILESIKDKMKEQEEQQLQNTTKDCTIFTKLLANDKKK